jgi:hypothetical protein
MTTPSSRFRRVGFFSLRAALLAHLIILVFSVHLFFVPAGAEIRPMGWGAVMLGTCVLALLIVVPTAVIAIIKESPRLPGSIALILGFTPFWFARFLLYFALWLKGFHLAP